MVFTISSDIKVLLNSLLFTFQCFHHHKVPHSSRPFIFHVSLFITSSTHSGQKARLSAFATTHICIIFAAFSKVVILKYQNQFHTFIWVHHLLLFSWSPHTHIIIYYQWFFSPIENSNLCYVTSYCPNISILFFSYIN